VGSLPLLESWSARAAEPRRGSTLIAAF
jgi:hypothetical protein